MNPFTVHLGRSSGVLTAGPARELCSSSADGGLHEDTCRSGVAGGHAERIACPRSILVAAGRVGLSVVLLWSRLRLSTDLSGALSRLRPGAAPGLRPGAVSGLRPRAL